jgi:hypothetical protein
VYADKNLKPVDWPEVAVEQKEAWDRCLERGKQLLVMQGEYQVTPEFRKEYWKPWYDANFYAAETADSLVVKGFLRSKPEYVLKLMMLISASETDSFVLGPPAFHAACEFLNQVQETLPRIFEHTGRNELSPITGAILRTVEANPDPMKVKTIYAKFSRDASIEEIDQMLSSLEKTDKIKFATLIVKGQAIMGVGLPDLIDALLTRG